jgi:hypothetical protein
MEAIYIADMLVGKRRKISSLNGKPRKLNIRAAQGKEVDVFFFPSGLGRLLSCLEILVAAANSNMEICAFAAMRGSDVP